MSTIYDNWGRLVHATLDREHLRELALCPSPATSFNSSTSAGFSFRSSFIGSASDSFRSSFNDEPSNHGDQAAWIHLTEQVMTAADIATTFKHQCEDLKRKSMQLQVLLHHMSGATDTLYYLPHKPIVDDIETILRKAVGLVRRCSGMRRIFSSIRVESFELISTKMEYFIGEVSWLLRDNEYSSSPLLVADEQTVLCYVCTLITKLIWGCSEDRVEAAMSLVSLARDVNHIKMIFDEGGVQGMLRLLEQGRTQGQEYAAKAIGLLAKDPEIANQIILIATTLPFVKMLKLGTTNLQAIVAWAISELAASSPQCQSFFAKENMIILLVERLWRGRSLYLVDVSNRAESSRNTSTQEKEDIVVYLNTMAVRALWHLAKGNGSIRTKILNTNALSHLSVLLEKGPDEGRHYSVMVLMEISYEVESAYKSMSAMSKGGAAYFPPKFLRKKGVYHVIIEQLLSLINIPDLELLVPCIKTVGNLAGTYMKKPHVKLQALLKLKDNHDHGGEVRKEAHIAYFKFYPEFGELI